MKYQRYDDFKYKEDHVADGSENKDDYEDCDSNCDDKVREERCSPT